MCLHRQLHAMPCICRQTRLAAVALYNALTTGCGSQTLGEEYCNMLQVDGGECYKLSIAFGRAVTQQRHFLTCLGQSTFVT